MDAKNHALCYFYRHPPSGGKSLSFEEIAKKVTKTDGSHPSWGSVRDAIANFQGDDKKTRGRPTGWRKTETKEDATILKTFKRVRPDGCGVDSRQIHSKLPKKLREKISRRTVIRRLADKGYRPTRKIQKSDPGPALLKRRLDWCKSHEGRTTTGWKTHLQAIGDMKDFTFYPQELRKKFSQLRAPWTYMTKAEKMKPAFVRPKRWFKKSEYKKVRKQKIFGFTTSNGKSLVFLVPSPWSTEVWAELIKSKVVPFLKKSFPHRRNFKLLLDGEPLLRGPAAKKAMEDGGVSLLGDWPKYSPDLNPQENVWAWAEKDLRKAEKDDDTFEEFKGRVLKSVKAFPGAAKLIPSLAARMKLCLEAKGAMIKY